MKTDLFFEQPPEVAHSFNKNERCTLINGETLKTLQGLPDGIAQLVISSPPYNIGKEYDARRELQIYLDGLRPMLAVLERVFADGGSFCWQTRRYVGGGEVFTMGRFFY